MYNPGKTNNNNNNYVQDIISTSRKEKESDELLYTVRSLVMVRNQLPAQWGLNSLKNLSKYKLFP